MIDQNSCKLCESIPRYIFASQGIMIHSAPLQIMIPGGRIGSHHALSFCTKMQEFWHIFISLLFRLGSFNVFWPSKRFKVGCKYTCIHKSSCLMSFWELQYTICNTTIKYSCYKRCSMFYLIMSGQQYENLFKQNLFHYLVQLSCIWLHIKSRFY